MCVYVYRFRVARFCVFSDCVPRSSYGQSTGVYRHQPCIVTVITVITVITIFAFSLHFTSTIRSTRAVEDIGERTTARYESTTAHNRQRERVKDIVTLRFPFFLPFFALRDVETQRSPIAEYLGDTTFVTKL